MGVCVCQYVCEFVYVLMRMFVCVCLCSYVRECVSVFLGVCVYVCMG